MIREKKKLMYTGQYFKIIVTFKSYLSGTQRSYNDQKNTAGIKYLYQLKKHSNNSGPIYQWKTVNRNGSSFRLIFMKKSRYTHQKNNAWQSSKISYHF